MRQTPCLSSLRRLRDFSVSWIISLTIFETEKCQLSEHRKEFWRSPSSVYTSAFRSFLCTLSPTTPRISRKSWGM
ncbi:hypothetical protein OWV82_006048 [Melia azedarach]|uniref:Uncharacterized protein n=1 Tax=Melia azedarach TaxID=155640 RepID=A0ACC1YFK1_MELAZ|nr:hypothetical protein OWV82_006048 [Melia azedarach]